MKKIYIEEDCLSADSHDDNAPLTIYALKNKVRDMAIMAEIEEKPNGFAVVRVQDGVGTGQYLASGANDLFWLKSKSEKVERRGQYSIFYLKLVATC